jgi:hypothetical protein
MRDEDTKVISYGTYSQFEAAMEKSKRAVFSHPRFVCGSVCFRTDDFDKPDFLILNVSDQFHSIRHSGEIGLTNGTTMVFVIFIVWRDATALFDMQIANKFFLKDGSIKQTLMSMRGIPAVDVEQVAANTCTKLASGLQPFLCRQIEWDELDLRRVTGREEQLKEIKGWGRLKNFRMEDLIVERSAL